MAYRGPIVKPSQAVKDAFTDTFARRRQLLDLVNEMGLGEVKVTCPICREYANGAGTGVEVVDKLLDKVWPVKKGKGKEISGAKVVKGLERYRVV